MIDTRQLSIKAGKGGNGAVSFLHAKFRPKGGPDGGDGGWGGSVYVVARKGVSTLGHLNHIYRVVADDGRAGTAKDSTGKKGKDRVIEVPLGTVVHEIRSDGEREELADLVTANVKTIFAKGGEPGRGNHRFATSTNQEPMFAEAGEPGKELELLLEVKVLGDVALVGAPNAGKSTLLGAISRAKPKIADYPFTTIEPVLGVVAHKGREMVFVDVPGLIEGAHAGVGLGHDFLRHIQRAGILVHLVEPEPTDGTDPLENYHAIRRELVEYDQQLGARPEIVTVTKADLPAAAEVQDRLAEDIKSPVLLVSAVTGQGLNLLIGAVARKLYRPDDE